MLVAEGDSWFDYPWHDVLRMLEDRHGYDVESVAHRGDTVESMAYTGQLEEFARVIEKLLRQNSVPDAILLSGGGNDIAGDQFQMLINHARAAHAGLNDQVVDGVIDVRVFDAYVTILSAVTEVCRQRTGTVVPIVIHGYDYSVPDGRGVLGGWGPLPGPWLNPACAKGLRRSRRLPGSGGHADRSLQRDAPPRDGSAGAGARALSGPARHASERRHLQDLVGERAAPDRARVRDGRGSVRVHHRVAC